jgi:hypothetical protein
MSILNDCGTRRCWYWHRRVAVRPAALTAHSTRGKRCRVAAIRATAFIDVSAAANPFDTFAPLSL